MLPDPTMETSFPTTILFGLVAGRALQMIELTEPF